MAPELLPQDSKQEQLVSPETERRHLWVEVTGVTASGKSTLARNISSQLGFRLVGEPDATAYPKFKEYYHDHQNKILAFGFQTWILQEHYYLINGVNSKETPEINIPGIREFLSEGPVVKEPPFRQNRLYAQARLEDNPFLLAKYTDFCDGLERGLRMKGPDLLVYTRISFPTMLRRIRDRVSQDPLRVPELKAPEGYWRRLWELQEDWINANPLNLTIVTINCDQFDYVRRPNKREADLGILGEFLNEFCSLTTDPETGERRIPEYILVPEAILNHKSPHAGVR